MFFFVKKIIYFGRGVVLVSVGQTEQKGTARDKQKELRRIFTSKRKVHPDQF